MIGLKDQTSLKETQCPSTNMNAPTVATDLKLWFGGSKNLSVLSVKAETSKS